MKVYISQTLLNSLSNLNACMHLNTNNVPELFTYKNKTYIIIGTVSSGAKGVHSVNAYECVLLENYKGSAISYAQHGFAVLDGTSERGLKNVTFKSKKFNWVIVGEAIEFLPFMEEKQLDLFE
jgi:hypothetical protein